MAHQLGISGSTILSEREKFPELFKNNLQHVEIGEFQDEDSFQDFIKQLRKTDRSFGLHSPLLRGQSKYDLIEKVSVEPQKAWEQFETEVAEMSRIGAEYILVHFPYFKKETEEDPDAMIEEGLQKLSVLQKKYGLTIVCEPKLGLQRSSAGINYLDRFSVETWRKYGLSICIDIGDYLMAAGDQALEYIKKWVEFVRVAHLHNVEYHGEKYIWVPVHPTHENDGEHFRIKQLLQFLAEESKNVFFVMEYTPHTDPQAIMVEEGYDWVSKIIEKRPVR
ncbi:sugar phosphate isomerase/epimerase [Bacillus sp. ISL-47]|uniref:TIM barrel protein n=1 Tax=Bacillus sp. ISL-47 TaxID=2819130 RepID=UPI001BE7C24D|nr:TIM barrel protein [Bacillus sp. ISL-47]MBT2691166.1 sugar phosphate isomerase/epimerase [Bacillus sp. ISL-47]MBT2711046.1 sugar phosphate isomerase/epimerase [Pseudomonas sp. ISL-84]